MKIKFELIKNIEFLIDDYERKVDDLQADISDFGGAFRKGALAAYQKIIDDLKELLEESEGEK